MTEKEFQDQINEHLDGLLFEVVEPETQKHYKIYGDGRTEGFTGNVIINNQFYAVAKTLLALQRRFFADSAPNKNLTPPNDGFPQAEAL